MGHINLLSKALTMTAIYRDYVLKFQTGFIDVKAGNINNVDIWQLLLKRLSSDVRVVKIQHFCSCVEIVKRELVKAQKFFVIFNAITSNANENTEQKTTLLQNHAVAV